MIQKNINSVPMDSRNLNYKQYTSQGSEVNEALEDYTFHNTTRLGISEVKQLLLKLDFVKEALSA